MPRYIDADALTKKIFPYDLVDKKCYSINAKAVYEEIEKAPTADVVEKIEIEWLEKKIQRLTNSMNAYFLGMVRLKEEKYNLTMEIFADIESDIEKLVQDARNCQEEYKSPAAKPFITLCEGKLSGLGEAKRVISHLKKKYTEGEPND